MLASANSYSQKTNTAISLEAWHLEKLGLVDITNLDSTILVSLMYATKDNFIGDSMYKTLREAYLQPEAAKKLVKANQYLKEENAEYKLIVLDATRPQWAQEIMWNKVKDTYMKKYVASPGRVSMHSYGVAVDLTILDKNNNELDMGTPVDFLEPLAEPRYESEFLASGKLNSQQIKNRELLRRIMKKAGFRGIPNEWWHFEALTRDEAQLKYKPINW